MKHCKRTLSFLLCLILLCGTMSVGASALPADEQWQTYSADYVEDGSAVYMAPGADENTVGIVQRDVNDGAGCTSGSVGKPNVVGHGMLLGVDDVGQNLH